MFSNKKHIYLPCFQGQVREMCKVQQSIKADKTGCLQWKAAKRAKYVTS